MWINDPLDTNYEIKVDTMDVFEDKLEKFTGLLDEKGNPIYRQKRKMGFDLNDKRKYPR